MEYYAAPPQELFDEIKKQAIAVWNTFSDEFGYASEKIDEIKDIQNIKDNAWHIIAMFDIQNRQIFLRGLSHKSLNYVNLILNEYENTYNF